MTPNKHGLFGLLLCWAVVSPALGETPTENTELSTKIIVPGLSGPVVDEVNLLKPLHRGQLEHMLRKMEESGKIQMAVLVTKTLGGFDIESYSMAVAEKWKLGKAGEDQGLILVIAPTERRMRFEVAYGLEGDITDAFSRQVLDNVMVPYFRKARFGEGIMAATEAVAKKLEIDLQAPIKNRIQQRTLAKRKRFMPFLPLFFILFWVLMFFRSIFLPFGAGRTWGYHSGTRFGGFGGGFSGGGGGFSGGGGGFGGGGASASW